MIVECQNCHRKVEVSGLGRPPLNIPVIKVYDTLRCCRSVTDAAKELGCSRAYVYKVLKVNGLKPKDIAK
jgi:hypothetical protein